MSNTQVRSSFAGAVNNQAPSQTQTPIPASPGLVEEFLSPNPSPPPRQAQAQAQAQAQPPRKMPSFKGGGGGGGGGGGKAIGFMPRQAESRVLKIGGAGFLFGVAGLVWLLSESTTLAIPRIFTGLVDVQPWNFLAWVLLLGMSFLIVAHTPHAGRLSIKDLWWVAFTLADTITTAIAAMSLTVQKLGVQHIRVTAGTDIYYWIIAGCTVVALLAVFAPIATMREAARLIRWEL